MCQGFPISARIADRAEAVLSVRVVATSGNETGYIIGTIKDPLRLRFSLEKERGKWFIVKTEGFERGAGMTVKKISQFR